MPYKKTKIQIPLCKKEIEGYEAKETAEIVLVHSARECLAHYVDLDTVVCLKRKQPVSKSKYRRSIYKSIDLSNEIAGDIEYYADRWNPDRLGRIEAKMRLLETIIRIERGGNVGYSQECWDRRRNGIDPEEIPNNGKVSSKHWGRKVKK